MLLVRLSTEDQTEVAEEPQKRDAVMSWIAKRATPFSRWGGKRSGPSAVQAKDRNWEGTLAEGAAFASLGGKRLPGFSSWGGKRDLTSGDGEAFAVWDSKSEAASGILSPGRGTWSSNSHPALGMLATRDYPAVTIAASDYQSTPLSSIWGSKRDSAFSQEGGKREPAFYSWGGKRNSGFDPWGGKKDRGFSSWDEKARSLFNGLAAEVTERGDRYHGWGANRYVTRSDGFKEGRTGNKSVHSSAKQDSPEVKYGKAQSGPVETDDQFPADLSGTAQVVTQNNNGEKAQSVDNVAAYESGETGQTTHNAVGGREVPSFVAKRSVSREGGNNRVGKAFSPWGGKRSQGPTSLLSILGSLQRSDSPRSLSDLLSKRGNYRHLSRGSKKWDPSPVGTVFSSWGGKRSVKLKEQNMLKIPPQSTSRQFRRGADFYSWGGKR
jgi:hypothetical protein